MSGRPSYVSCVFLSAMASGFASPSAEEELELLEPEEAVEETPTRGMAKRSAKKVECRARTDLCTRKSMRESVSGCQAESTTLPSAIQRSEGYMAGIVFVFGFDVVGGVSGLVCAGVCPSAGQSV